MAAPKASAVFPFLRSCKQECETPIQGEVKGEIPKWLKGSLIRIGSGLLEIGPDKYNHIFDGMALMHRFSFQDGNVTYQNRFLRSDAYKENTRANRIIVTEFGTRGVPDPCKTIFQRFASLFSMDMTDNDLINIIMYGNEAFACSETNNIWKIDTETLESLEKVNLQNYLPIVGAIAHAHEDTDGTVYNVGSSCGFYSYYNIIKFPPKENKNESPFDNGSVVCRIPASKFLSPCYYHSFAMTENYFIMVEQPLYLSLPRMAWVHFISGTYSEAMTWDVNTPCRFHVVRRSDGQLLDTSYIASPFFVFHHINAYEEDDHIVLDLCAYEKGEVVNALYVKSLEEVFSKSHKYEDPFKSKARRYVLPLDVERTEEENERNLVTLKGCEATATLDADGSIFCTFEILTGTEPWTPELPRIHYEKYNGKKYEYFYAMAQNETIGNTHLIKVNTHTKKTISWSEDGAIPSEPVFLAEPDPVTEDEDSGVLLASLLYEDDENKVSLLVLDAKTMEEIGRVTFKCSSSVPANFHGIFVPKN